MTGAPDRPCQTPPEDSKRWWQEPRWKGKAAPKNPSPQWTRAAAMRRHGLIFGDDENNAKIHGVALARCASGSELVAAFRKGDFFLFPLEERRGVSQIPIGAKWNMRGKRVELLQAIVAAMIADGGREGLVATLEELGTIVRLRRTQVGEYLHELQAWGLIVADPIFVPYGRVCSQRANCYRITTTCAAAYRLVVRVKLPDPRPTNPRPKRVRRPAGAPAPVPVQGVVGSRARELANGNPEANPDNPVPGYSSGEAAALLEKIEHPPASPGAARPCVPDASPTRSQPAVPGPTRSAGLSRAVLANARAYGATIGEVRKGRVDERKGFQRLPGVIRAERERDLKRRAELDEQIARRELARKAPVPAEIPPAAPVAAAPIVERPPALEWVESEEAKRLRLERERRRNNPIATDDEDFWNTIQNTLRGRGVDVDNGVLGHFISTQRKGRS